MFARITLLSVGLLALASGCSPYVEGFHYRPHPAVADVRLASTQPSAQAQSPLTAYASVGGVRREDQKQHIPLSVEVRMRLDNHGPQEVIFDPHTLQLTDAQLVRFPPPLGVPAEPVTIPPEQSFMIQANFPFPPGLSYDNGGMETLQLHWMVQIGGHIVPQNAAFGRIHEYYMYDPYWDYPMDPFWRPYPYVGFGGTFVIR